MKKGICERCSFPVFIVKCHYCGMLEYTCKHCGYERNFCKPIEGE